MTGDIVARLRRRVDHSRVLTSWPPQLPLIDLDEAAAEIERLRAEIARKDLALQFVCEELCAPEPNCSCHISPPYNDCVDHSSIRDVLKEARTALSQPAQEIAPDTFQQRVHQWIIACFGPVIAVDKIERNHRFLEEALELVQSCGCTQSEAHQLVDYVFGRPVGEPKQEVGGVLNTLAALCNAQQIDMDQCGEAELARVWTKVEQIRAKQAAKPKQSPLPGPSEPEPEGSDKP